MKNQTHHASPRLGLILALSGLMSVATVVAGLARPVFAQTVYPSWSFTGSLNTARRLFTATLLQNGKVLVAGGINNTGNSCSRGMCLTLNTAELYDPATGAWTFTGSLNLPRESHTATLLPNGKVLVVGGFVVGPSGQVRNSAELYDPANGTWANTGSLNTAFDVGLTATLLTNGKVLVVGNVGSSAELYDPSTGTWSSTGNLNTARNGHSATLLLNGKVLVAGGSDNTGVLKSAELYDPATGMWSVTGNLNTARYIHSATLLPSGKVLVVGDGQSTNSSELYDPANGTWSYTGNLSYGQSAEALTLLPNGRVLTAGGNNLSRAELYDPVTGKWNLTAYLNTGRIQHATTQLADGRVLVAGGYDNAYNDLNTAELYDPSASPNINIIDDAKFFAQQHYFDFLQREPDRDGLAFWTNEMTSCGADAGCRELKRINVSAAFYLSIEFQETGYFVYRVHKAAFGNLPGAPIPVKVDEFLWETAEVGQGVIVGQPGWEQVLESNKQFFLNDPDGVSWTSAYPTSMTPAQFVDTLFANAGVVPSSTDRTAAINEFGSATTTADFAARLRALRRVVDNSTLKQQEFNRAFVLMQYFGYLRRNPNDPPEPTLDFQGYNFWLNKLNQFNGNFIQAEMVKAFLVSTEYRQRFGQP